ncbi:MAG: DUF4474 domain-containing protein, partial [Pseudobutyrivibrio sp.]|nr:DUF4474 domain-containing protein [Pseudobutyrivibrio sp.]
LERTVNGETESFIYDNNVISMSKSGRNYYYLQDELGSPMYMTGTDGVAVSSYAFDDFGRNVDPFTGKIKEANHKHGYTTDGNIIQPFAFTGYQEDEVSGLKFAQARFYSAENGRFVGEDQDGGLLNGPESINSYLFCVNNPKNLIDKNGKFPSFYEITRGIAHAVIANPLAVYITQNGYAEEGFDIVGFTEEKNAGQGTGIYHAKFDCWQQYFGYNDLYDFAFDLGTSMNRAKFEFSATDEDGNVKNYILWGWKGDYLNLGAGGEFGIYEEVIDIDGNKHYKVNKDIALPMTLQIVDSSGNVIIDYNPNSPQWWITGFNSNYQNMKAGNLNMVFTIDFSSNLELYEAFINSASYLDNIDKWRIDSKNQYILTFTWEGNQCLD